jgi:hypothetical protein
MEKKLHFDHRGNSDELASQVATVFRRTYKIFVVTLVLMNQCRRYCHGYASQVSTVFRRTYNIYVVSF